MRTRLLILSLFLIACAGCNNPFNTYVHIHDRYPVYEKNMPAKTVLPKISKTKLESLDTETQKQIIDSVTGLKSEAAQLRALLDSYNEYAKRKNAEYDQLFHKD